MLTYIFIHLMGKGAESTPRINAAFPIFKGRFAVREYGKAKRCSSRAIAKWRKEPYSSSLSMNV